MTRDCRRNQQPMYYDRQGVPILNTPGMNDATLKWGRLAENRAYKIVEQTQVGPYWISTVWLGLDHSFRFEGPPLIFETMVFGIKNYGERDCERYSTEEQARAGHIEMVAKFRALADDDMKPPGIGVP